MTAEAEVVERPPVGYTAEGKGVVATCKGCGWEIWKPAQHDAEEAARDHKKCRADLVALHARLERTRDASHRPRRRP